MTSSWGLLCCGLFLTGIVTVFCRNSPEHKSNHPDYHLGVRYDEYPMIVPKKRAALLLDRIMVALQKAIEEEEATNRVFRENSSNNPDNNNNPAEDAIRTMDLQRRGHQSGPGQQIRGRVYWRCYFNAVTCFK